MVSIMMTFHQRNLDPIDASSDGEITMNISQFFDAKAGTKEELTNTGQYQSGQPSQLPQVPCFAQPIDSNFYDLSCQHRNSPTRPLVGQNMRSSIRKGRHQLIQKTLRNFSLLSSFVNGDEFGGERIAGDDIEIRLVPLGKDTKA